MLVCTRVSIIVWRLVELVIELGLWNIKLTCVVVHATRLNHGLRWVVGRIVVQIDECTAVVHPANWVWAGEFSIRVELHLIWSDWLTITVVNLHAHSSCASTLTSFLGDHKDRVEVLLGNFVVLRVNSPMMRQKVIVDSFKGDVGVNIKIAHSLEPVHSGDIGLSVELENLVTS